MKLSQALDNNYIVSSKSQSSLQLQLVIQWGELPWFLSTNIFHGKFIGLKYWRFDQIENVVG